MRWLRLLGPSRTLRIAMCIEAAVPAVLALVRNALVAGAALVFFGFHAIVWGALLTSLRQELTPAGLRGRIESAFRFNEIRGATPGALLGGVFATRYGLTAPFWLGAVVGAVLVPCVWHIFSDASVAAARRDAEKEESTTTSATG